MNLGKIINLWSEQKISVLSIGHEDNHEHELERHHIRSTPGKTLFTQLLFVDFNSPGQSGIELVHCPVEGDVLEQLEPGTEHVDGQDVGGGLLPEAQGVKVSKGLRLSEKRLNIVLII